MTVRPLRLLSSHSDVTAGNEWKQANSTWWRMPWGTTWKGYVLPCRNQSRLGLGVSLTPTPTLTLTVSRRAAAPAAGAGACAVLAAPRVRGGGGAAGLHGDGAAVRDGCDRDARRRPRGLAAATGVARALGKRNQPCPGASAQTARRALFEAI